MGSLVHRSVPTNLKWFPNCSPAHTLFQDRFKYVQVFKVVQYTVHSLVSLIGDDQLPPLWTHPTGSDFVRGSKLVAKPHVAEQRKLTRTQVLLLQSLWTPVEFPYHNNNHAPWPQACRASHVLCGQHASLQLPTKQILPLLVSLQERLQIDPNNLELANPRKPCRPQVHRVETSHHGPHRLATQSH